MKKITKKIKHTGETTVRKPINLRRHLNLELFDLLDETRKEPQNGLPIITCTTDAVPDFLALYTEPSKYHITNATGVCFYVYDRHFDNKDGLFNAIYYNDKKLLSKYKERFKNVKFVISPDYTISKNIELVVPIENMQRMERARIICLWFIYEIGAVVIPSISYASLETLPKYTAGLEYSSVIALSTKGHVRYTREKKLFKEVVRYVVDNFPLKTILLYSVCGKDSTSLKLLKYAIDKGINIVIPQNTLRQCNQLKAGVVA